MQVHITWKQSRWIMEDEAVRVLHLDHNSDPAGLFFYYT